MRAQPSGGSTPMNGTRRLAAASSGAAAAALLLLVAAGPAVGQQVGEAASERAAGAAAEVALEAVPETGPGTPASAGRTAGQEASLYQRLGGIYPIASVVDVFIDLLYHNDVLNENPAIREARARVPLPGLKYHVTAMVCQATGGPCEYTGRSMKEAHAHLNIDEREWQAMLSDLRRTLNDFQVPEGEQEELIAIVQSTKDDIVVEED